MTEDEAKAWIEERFGLGGVAAMAAFAAIVLGGNAAAKSDRTVYD
ncbi:hypothetical protein [Sphingomonas sp. Ant H11]|nr:hypothetical protein [Sphingomonas sp. Ant H11]